MLTTWLVWGRWLYAVGGNPEAARRSSIPTRRVLVTVYVLSGLAAGVGGLLTAGLIDGGSPTAGDLAELDSIAAVIIGGAAFAGGRGNVGNALVGAFTIGVIRNALNLHNVDPFYQLMAIGVIVLIAVEADVLRGLHRGPRAGRAGDEARMSALAAPSRCRGAPVLTVRGASKRFGAVAALDGIDLDVRRGEVLALLGDNGAGKSTLIKCLNGVHRLDSGMIEMDGVPVAIHAPADARALGHRDRLPGSRAVRQPAADRQLLRRPRARRAGLAAALAARAQAPADDGRDARGARAAPGDAARFQRRRRSDVRRPAAGGRRQPRRGVRVEGRDPRRADRRARRARVAQGARPDPAAARREQGGARRLARHGSRDGGRRPRRRAARRSQGRRADPDRRDLPSRSSR